LVKGFEGTRVRRVFAGAATASAIGEDGELFSWGWGDNETLGHGDRQNQPSPKRVEALRGTRMSSVAVGMYHAVALHHVVALTEGGLVYAWGTTSVKSNPHVENKLLPRAIEALQGVRVGGIAAAGSRSYAVADTGELWAWGAQSMCEPPLGHGEQGHCRESKPIESLRGIKVDAVAAGAYHTLALADDGSVYSWGKKTWSEALGLGSAVSDAREDVLTPQRIPELGMRLGMLTGGKC
jgi:alpha-tubulin suppressor-like RCC1 family protein